MTYESYGLLKNLQCSNITSCWITSGYHLLVICLWTTPIFLVSTSPWATVWSGQSPGPERKMLCIFAMLQCNCKIEDQKSFWVIDTSLVMPMLFYMMSQKIQRSCHKLWTLNSLKENLKFYSFTQSAKALTSSNFLHTVKKSANCMFVSTSSFAELLQNVERLW